MEYRKIKKNGDELSILGYGCMRYPRKNGRIDFDRTKKQIMLAIEMGVNYFDTAYLYPGSEELLGKVLAENYREKIKIATKLPIISIKNRENIDKTFEKQLKRLQTDYIDYYYLHNLNFEDWTLLKDDLIDFIKKEKRSKENPNGRIINIGFSFHGNIVNFKKIVDDYDWDTCMIQYNYLDENYQAGKEGLNYAAAKGLGIIVMEPLRGGMLVKQFPKLAKKIIDSFPIKRTPAEWAFKWLYDNPKIDVVLSGMNKKEEIEENIEIASNTPINSLTEEEKELIEKIKNEFTKKIVVDCTGCGYCLPCPKGVDIPSALSSRNDMAIFGGAMVVIQYLMITMDNNSSASKCIKCGICEKKCPQHIDIMNELEITKSDLEKFHFKIIAKIVKFIMRRFL